jgi:hypothetical protein
MKKTKINYKEKDKEIKKIECPICLQKLKYKIDTECKHTFCDICIVKHLMIKNTCPMCRKECDYEYITHQINSKRQKIIMRKLLPPVTINNIHTEIVQPMNIYSRFFPQHLPASIIMISIFIVEVYIIICLIIIITQTITTMI